MLAHYGISNIVFWKPKTQKQTESFQPCKLNAGIKCVPNFIDKELKTTVLSKAKEKWWTNDERMTWEHQWDKL